MIAIDFSDSIVGFSRAGERDMLGVELGSSLVCLDLVCVALATLPTCAGCRVSISFTLHVYYVS